MTQHTAHSIDYLSQVKDSSLLLLSSSLKMSLMDEFAEALSSEVMVDLDKLRELSRQGIPMAFRGQVW
ncbi:hypothetical protein HMI54_002103, partial [Coelomomyces lativittatus]